MKTAVALLLTAFAFPAFALFDARVIDGDTVNVPRGVVKNFPARISVRLAGVNTGETRGAKCAKEKEMGEAAKVYVRDRLAKAGKVKVEYVRLDKYGGRIVGRITVDGEDLSQAIIKAGLGVPYDGGAKTNVWCK